jgi:hypothetical protein
VTDHNETLKHSLDIAFAAVVGGAWLKILPTVATILGIVWYLIRIWESDTVKQLTGRPIRNQDFIDTLTFRRYRKEADDAQRK